MTKHIKMITVAGLLCLAATLPLARADGNLDTYLNSAYLWRGQLLNDEPVLQPSLTATAKNGLSFNVWGNFNLTDSLGSSQENEFNEIDPMIAYTLPVEAASVQVGLVQYTFPHQTIVDSATNTTAYPGTHEAFVTVGLDTILKPNVKVYYDFDQADGFYGQAGVAHSIDLLKDLSLDLSASVAAASSDYNTYYFGVDDDALNDGNVIVGLTYKLNDAWVLGGYVQYARLLDSKIRDAANESTVYFNKNDMVVGGVHASYSF